MYCCLEPDHGVCASPQGAVCHTVASFRLNMAPNWSAQNSPRCEIALDTADFNASSRFLMPRKAGWQVSQDHHSADSCVDVEASQCPRPPLLSCNFQKMIWFAGHVLFTFMIEGEYAVVAASRPTRSYYCANPKVQPAVHVMTRRREPHLVEWNREGCRWIESGENAIPVNVLGLARPPLKACASTMRQHRAVLVGCACHAHTPVALLMPRASHAVMAQHCHSGESVAMLVYCCLHAVDECAAGACQ